MDLEGNVAGVVGVPREMPVTNSKRLIIAVAAVSVLVLFYIFCLISVVWICCAIMFMVIGAVITRGISAAVLGPAMRAQNELATTIIGGMKRTQKEEYNIPLSREDAPGLFDLTRSVAVQIGVDSPERVVLSLGDGCWVRLLGYNRRSGNYTLCVSYSSLAILTEGEFSTVLAHELAHAKLYHRGFGNWLTNGLVRMSQVASRTLDLIDISARSKKPFHTASLAHKVVSIFGEYLSSLLASYNRQEEFDADAMSAKVYGSGLVHQCLTRLYVSRLSSRSLSWRDCVLQLQRGGSFHEWFRSRLIPDDEAELHRFEKLALNGEWKSRYDSHPRLADRLAALPNVESSVASNQPAIDLLADPEGIVRRFAIEAERIASNIERQETAMLRKKMSAGPKTTAYSATQQLAMFMIVIGIFGGAIILAAIVCAGFYLSMAVTLACCIALIVGGSILYRKFPLRETTLLPVPEFGVWEQSISSEKRDSYRNQEISELTSELQKSVPRAVKGKKALSRYWDDMAYEALSRCDYAGALAASRLAVNAKKDSVPGLLALGISSAFFGFDQEAVKSLNQAFKLFPSSWSTRWGLGWGCVLLGDWKHAECHFHEALAFRRADPTVLSALGVSKWRRNASQEALENIRKAVSVAPHETPHRILLTRLLLSMGYAREALEEQQTLEKQIPENIDVMIFAVHARGLLGDIDGAERWADETERAHPEASTLLRLGRVFDDCELHDRSRSYYERLCKLGFFPDALVAIGYDEYKRKDTDKARELLNSALDLTKELGDGASSPLELLGVICQALASIEEAKENCAMWKAQLKLKRSANGISSLNLQVCAETREAAKVIVDRLHSGLYPGEDIADCDFVIGMADKSNQPAGPIAPGIYGFSFTT